ncbi:MAG: hypothetical protein HOW97_22550, partial [Catenulispora sp.]|nr:hypothetical protein [Catenulispora sp.]
VLLAFAPRHIAEEFGGSPDVLSPEQVFLLHHRPLAPGLVRRALDPGAGPEALPALLGNRATPTAALLRLLHHPADPVATRISLLSRCRDPEIRYAALEELEKLGVPWAQINHFVKNLGQADLYQLIAAAPTPQRLHFLLRKFGRYLGPDATALLYGRLAEQAGPEPVWDVAAFLAGAVDSVDPAVRASMAGADTAPLLRAAELAAARDLPGLTTPDPGNDPEPHPDDPAEWPLEDAVRRLLDGRPDRWQALVRRLMTAGDLDYQGLTELVETTAAALADAGEES